MSSELEVEAGHQRLLHHRAVRALAVSRHMNHLGGGHDDALAGFHHAPGGLQLAALKGREKVDLVFHRGHFHALGRDGECGVAAGDVGQRAHGAAVKAALLLGHALRVRHGQRHRARRHAEQAHAQRLHHALAVQAGLNPLAQGFVIGGGIGHGGVVFG